MTLVESASLDEKWCLGMEHWTMTMVRFDGGVVQFNLVGPWYYGVATHVHLKFKHDGKITNPTDGIRTIRELDLLGCPKGCVLIWNENGV